MSAEEHLGAQFEVLHKHRAIRIGAKTYPALRTFEMGGPNGLSEHQGQPGEHRTAVSAWIPMENGNLVRVANWAEDGPMVHQISRVEGAHTAEPHYREDAVAQLMTTTHGADVHHVLHQLGTEHLSPGTIAVNRQHIDRLRRVNKSGEGIWT